MQAVFSAWRADNDLITNIESSRKARQFLTDCGLPHWDAVGAYKEDGQDLHTQEVSHVVHCDLEDVDALIDIACLRFKQECVLVVSSHDNSATLESIGNSESIGTLTQVSKAEAQRNQSYTYFLGDYYICQ